MEFESLEKSFKDYLSKEGYEARKDVVRGLEALTALQNNTENFTKQDEDLIVAAAQIIEKHSASDESYEGRMVDYRNIIRDSEDYSEFTIKCQTADLPVLSEETFECEQQILLKKAIGSEGDLECKTEGESEIVTNFGQLLADRFFTKVRQGEFDETYKCFSSENPHVEMSYEDFRNFSENPLTTNNFVPEGSIEYAFSQMLDEAKLLYQKDFSYEPRRLEQEFNQYLKLNAGLFADIMYQNFSQYYDLHFGRLGDDIMASVGDAAYHAKKYIGDRTYYKGSSPQEVLTSKITDPLHRAARDGNRATYHKADAERNLNESAESAWRSEGMPAYRDQVEWAQVSGNSIKNPDAYKKKWMKDYYKKHKKSAMTDAQRKADLMGHLSESGASVADVLVRGGVNKLMAFSNGTANVDFAKNPINYNQAGKDARSAVNDLFGKVKTGLGNAKTAATPVIGDAVNTAKAGILHPGQMGKAMGHILGNNVKVAKNNLNKTVSNVRDSAQESSQKSIDFINNMKNKSDKKTRDALKFFSYIEEDVKGYPAFQHGHLRGSNLPVNFNSSLAKDTLTGGGIGLLGGGFAGAAKSALTADKEYDNYVNANEGRPDLMTRRQFKAHHMKKNIMGGAGIGVGLGLGAGALKNSSSGRSGDSSDFNSTMVRYGESSRQSNSNGGGNNGGGGSGGSSGSASNKAFKYYTALNKDPNKITQGDHKKYSKKFGNLETLINTVNDGSPQSNKILSKQAYANNFVSVNDYVKHMIDISQSQAQGSSNQKYNKLDKRDLRMANKAMTSFKDYITEAQRRKWGLNYNFSGISTVLNPNFQ